LLQDNNGGISVAFSWPPFPLPGYEIKKTTPTKVGVVGNVD